MFDLDVFGRGLALLIFLIAFYALASRERKTPSIVQSVYPAISIVFLSLALTLIAPVIRPIVPNVGNFFTEVASPLVLIVALINVFYGVWSAHNRHANLRDDKLVRNIRLVRRCKRLLRKLRSRPDYEHNAQSFSDTLISRLTHLSFVDKDKLESALKKSNGNYAAVAVRTSTFNKCDAILIDLAKCFLENGLWVQYTVCGRHPIHFVQQLKNGWTPTDPQHDWTSAAQRLVVVDGFSPHYGFTDSICWKRSDELRETFNVHYCESGPTYAGIHSAAAKAFNIVKAHSLSGNVRQPTLVIYEGLVTLADLESAEQYRILCRHVLSSERLWEGMLTVFAEQNITDVDFRILELYSDLQICDSTSSSKENGGVDGNS